jgi:hypothetical protein
VEAHEAADLAVGDAALRHQPAHVPGRGAQPLGRLLHDAAVRSKGTLYLALHQHGTYAWGRWVGMSYDGPVVSGWGAIARTEDQAHQVVLDLIKSEPS